MVAAKAAARAAAKAAAKAAARAAARAAVFGLIKARDRRCGTLEKNVDDLTRQVWYSAEPARHSQE